MKTPLTPVITQQIPASHNIIYANAGATWTNGLPLGNGDMGALAYVPFFPEWLINNVDVWDYREPTFPQKRTIADVRSFAPVWKVRGPGKRRR